MPTIPTISDAEWEVMAVLWTTSPLTANEVVDRLEGRKTWSPRTVKTLLNRLVNKKALAYETRGNRYLYRPANIHDFTASKNAAPHPVTFPSASSNDPGDAPVPVGYSGKTSPPNPAARIPAISNPNSLAHAFPALAFHHRAGRHHDIGGDRMLHPAPAPASRAGAHQRRDRSGHRFARGRGVSRARSWTGGCQRVCRSGGRR